MTAKQLAGNTAPDNSTYITLTDGNGNLVNISSGSGITGLTATTPVSGISNGAFLFNNSGTVAGNTSVMTGITGGSTPVTGVSGNYILTNSSGKVGSIPAISTATTWSVTDGSTSGLTITNVNSTYVTMGPMVVASLGITYPTTTSTGAASIVLPSVPTQGNDNFVTLNSNAAIGLLLGQLTGNKLVFFKGATSAQVSVSNSSLSGGTIQGTITYF